MQAKNTLYDVARGQGACRLPCAHTRLTLLHASPLHVRERGRLIISGTECAMCGRQCRYADKRTSLVTAYDGAGLPPAEELARYVPESWKILRGVQDVALPALPEAAWLHNESAASGRNCYKIVLAVWQDISTKQVAASANPGPGLTLTPALARTSPYLTVASLHVRRSWRRSGHGALVGALARMRRWRRPCVRAADPRVY